MSKQQTNSIKNQKGKYQQGSGTKYHNEHAGSVPGYGNNQVDQVQKS
ncbi:hypothetical protein ACIFOT_07285 [Neobacillus sp. NRS-1170]